MNGNKMKCPYCSTAQGRCATTSAGRHITECTSCGRVVEERQTQSHHLFHLRAQDYPLCLVTSDLPTVPISAATNLHKDEQQQKTKEEEDPFEHTGFITAFSTWSLEPYPVFTQSSLSFAGHLSELERVLETALSSSSNSNSSSGPSVVVDNLRAYLQIIDVASILRLDCDISDHAFQLFRDCSSATCLRNRSVEALATAARHCRSCPGHPGGPRTKNQEPSRYRDWQDITYVANIKQLDDTLLTIPQVEISIAANLPQKEIGKYIKILGEALQLSQPINSNSISVHMPRFCTLLQLNKSAQELATNIGEVVVNKCFCTRRNPISSSAAAIYLACQLEDKRKTQAEICMVTGLTEVTLRKVYKELLENWDDLLPSNYTPAVPPEKAFPAATISSGRSATPRADIAEGSSLDRYKHPEINPTKPIDVSEACLQIAGKENTESKDNFGGTYNPAMQQAPAFWKQPQAPSGTSMNNAGEKNQNMMREMDIDKPPNSEELEKKVDKDVKSSSTSLWQGQFSSTPAVNASSVSFAIRPPVPMGTPPPVRYVQMPKVTTPGNVDSGTSNQNESKKIHQNGDS